jgi:ankyrin repeat protein
MGNETEKSFDAVRAGDAEALRALLASNPAIAGARNDQGLSLLMQASYFQRKELVQLLLDAAPPIDIFEAATVPGMADRAARLLEDDPSLAMAWSVDGFTPLHLSAYFGRIKVAELLLGQGADPDAVSRNAMSLRPLHSAAASRSLEIMKLVLDRGASVNSRQHGGWTPLHSAASHGDLAAIELLLARGADARLLSDDGKTAFDMAVDKGHIDASRLLQV